MNFPQIPNFNAITLAALPILSCARVKKTHAKVFVAQYGVKPLPRLPLYPPR